MSDPTKGRPDEIPEEELVHEDDSIIGTAFKWSLLAIAILVAGIAAAIYLNREEVKEETIIAKDVVAPKKLVQEAAARPNVTFTDITTDAGVEFTHRNGATGGKYLPETMGGGVAFFDYDNDGDQDLFLVNSRDWDETTGGDTSKLYENDGTGRFTDATSNAGLDVRLYGMGVAVADYDGDGWVDLFLTAVGSNRLFRNVEGRFTDVTEAAKLAGNDDEWSTSAGFFDFDNDGDLDLFVCNYVRWSAQIDRDLNFTLNGTDRAYGPPKSFTGSYPYLYRNDGGGRFADISKASGVQVDNKYTGEPAAKALAISFADVDADGWLDIFVANDTVQNFVFRNNQDGTFDEVGVASGVAYDGMGNATGAMGIDTANYLNDSQLAVAIGNFANETTSFYVMQGTETWEFAEMSDVEGIGSPSRLRLSFGVFFLDYDLDGRLDLIQANGHLEEEINQIQPSQHYEQPAQLFWNAGLDSRSTYVEVPSDEVGDLARPIVGRGAAHADIDGDGDLDVILTQTGGPPLLLRNEQDLGNHWLRVKLVGKGGNRDSIGASISLAAGGVTQHRQVMPTKSYLTQVELPLTFGLGDHTDVDSLEIRWPDGSTERVDVEAVDRQIEVVQGD